MERDTLRRASFRYTPLDPSVDCIRLLALYPYDKRNPERIECELRTVTFSQKPMYEALSYTWGDSNPTEMIWLDGQPFAMHENLYNALDNLRPIGRQPRMLWADAICIDQSNLDERKRQVGLMDYIYTRASTVLIWLGRGTPEVQKGYLEVSKSMDFPLYLSSKQRQSVARNKQSCQNWQQWVYRRSHWTRLWVIQEIGLSKRLRVCIGRQSESWDCFLRCLELKHFKRRGYGTDDEYEYEHNLICKLDEKRKGRHGSDNRLERLLEDFQYAGCKDRRDKVYGLLGLAYDCQDGSVEPDYTKSLFGLYTDVLTW